MKMKRVTFEGALGDNLSASIEWPDSEPRAFALFAHCFTCSKNVFAASRITKALAADGIAVMRFDFTGLGNSEGEFANTNFSSNVGDLVAAADFLRREYEAPSLLIGHSLGGSAALAAAPQIPEVAAVATIAAPHSPQVIEHLLASDVDEIEAKGEATVSIGGRPFRIKKQFLDDLREQDAEASIANLGRALLIFHSPDDPVVPIANAESIFAAAQEPRSFITLEGADHLLSQRRDAVYVANILSAWADRYLAPASSPEPPADVEYERRVHVEENGRGKYAQDIFIGPHSLLGDEPQSVGGDDLGPSPYELLLAALGTCTSMTMRMYADRKGWPLESVEVELVHEKEKVEGEGRRTTRDHIVRHITIVGDDLDDAQRERIFEIANRCPVHRTLEADPRIESVLASNYAGDGQ